MIDEATIADPFFSGEGLDICLCNHFSPRLLCSMLFFLVQMHVYSFNSMLDFFVPRNFLFEIT